MSFTKQFLSLIKKGENEVVKLILDDSNFHHAYVRKGVTLLHFAIDHGNAEITKYLIDKGCNIDAQNPSGYTPLMLAVESRSGVIIQILLQAGADVLDSDEYGYDALYYALQQYPSATVLRPIFRALQKIFTSRQIAKKLMDLNCLLDSAVYSMDATMVEYMIKRGVPVKLSYETDQFPLHIAVELSDLKMVKLLLKYGTDIEAVDTFGTVPLNCLYDGESEREDERLEILKIFLSRKVELMLWDPNGDFQIEPTLVRGSSEAVSLVLHSYIDLCTRNGRNATLLHYLAKNRNPGVVDELKKFITAFDVNAGDVDGFTPLSRAASTGNLAMLQFLLEQGAKADKFAIFKVYCTHVDSDLPSDVNVLRDRCAEILLQHGADPEAIFGYSSRWQVQNLIKNKHFDRLKLAVARVAIRERKGAVITESTRLAINSRLLLKKYLKKCSLLLDKKISGSVSVFDLLSADEKKVVKYLNNDKLVMKLNRIGRKQKLQSAYWYFHSTLKKSISKGIVNKALRSNAAEIVCKMSGGRLGPRHLATEMLIDHLNDHDIRKLYWFENNFICKYVYK